MTGQGRTDGEENETSLLESRGSGNTDRRAVGEGRPRQAAGHSVPRCDNRRQQTVCNRRQCLMTMTRMAVVFITIIITADTDTVLVMCQEVFDALHSYINPRRWVNHIPTLKVKEMKQK